MISAEVYLWGTRIGVVAQENVASVPVFNYDDRFLQSGIEVSPLTMPLSRRVYSFSNLNKDSFHGLPGLLADSLPDKFGTRMPFVSGI
ncbi:MAG: HipA N-terminal domain-containing protein [Tyzzerella sp.]|nr:HipA N-terminal domain-containing protein [Tyzzerella sp.]